MLFDGRPEADADVAAQAKSFFDQLAAERKLLTIPAVSSEAAKLAPHYVNDALGDITVSRKGAATVFDFGEWQSEVATRHNPDGSLSFITIAPGISGFEFVVGSGPKPSLIVRDAQHEYVFAGDGTTSRRNKGTSRVSGLSEGRRVEGQVGGGSRTRLRRRTRALRELAVGQQTTDHDLR